MSRPSDHIDSPTDTPAGSSGGSTADNDSVGAAPASGSRMPRGGGSAEIKGPKLGLVGWLRWFWRQLTSMRTALLLLLLLAIAAVPGSLVPQRSSDPNGVAQYFRVKPELAPILDGLQAFDVYTSVWFSSIYLLLFASLIGCVIPRTKHHLQALRQKPPKTPARLQRLPGFTVRDGRRAGSSGRADPTSGRADSATEVSAGRVTAASAIESARDLLRRSGYRTVVFDGEEPSVSAERGYLRETGNLIFHIALLGILVAVGFGGGFGFTGQRVLVEGQTFVNSLVSYDSFNPGRFFNDHTLDPYALTVDNFEVVYQDDPEKGAYGQPLDYIATVTTKPRDGAPASAEIKVNEPLGIGGTNVYLLGNGYAPTLTVRDPDGNVVFTDSTPFLPQDTNLTSLGVIKIPDGLKEQLGLIGFFYPTQEKLATGAYTSVYPDLVYPVLTLDVYQGDLGLDSGRPESVYSLDTDSLTQLAGRKTDIKSIELQPGESAALPNGLGTVAFEDIKRFASFDIHRDPTQGWVLALTILVVGGLMAGLLVPRRRIWVKALEKSDGSFELQYAGLARGEDPGLEAAVAEIADRHSATLT